MFRVFLAEILDCKGVNTACFFFKIRGFSSARIVWLELLGDQMRSGGEGQSSEIFEGGGQAILKRRYRILEAPRCGYDLQCGPSVRRFPRLSVAIPSYFQWGLADSELSHWSVDQLKPK
jgi:hypothetical protein